MEKMALLNAGGKGGNAVPIERQHALLLERFAELHYQYRLAILSLCKIRGDRAFASSELMGARETVSAKDKEITLLRKQVSGLKESLAKLEHLQRILDGGKGIFGENGLGDLGDFLGFGKKR